MANRYDKRLQDEDLWQVYEIKTGQIVLIAGQPYDGMAQHEAAEIVALLEAGILEADTSSPEQKCEHGEGPKGTSDGTKAIRHKL